MDQLYCLQADVLKVLAQPRRLEILHLLADGPRGVGQLAAALGVTQPNVSQHLAVMRTTGLVEAERDGRGVQYRISDPEVMVACRIMRGVLQRRLDRLAHLTATTAIGGRQPAARVSGGDA